MISKIFKYLLFLMILIIVVGGCSWLIAKWFMINDPIPEGALKVMTKIIQ